MNSNSNSNAPEGDFGSCLQRYINGSGSINEVIGHSEFLTRLKRFARTCNFSVFGGERDWDDLCQNILLKLLNEDLERKLRFPGNIQNEGDFFTWLFVLARNHHLSNVRHRLAKKRDGLRSDKPLEDYEFLIFDYESAIFGNFDEAEEESYLGRFMEFINKYPVKRQLVIRLWLKDRPYRNIQKVLKRLLGEEVSHVTVGNWINATIEAFRKSLDLPPREPPKRSKKAPSRRPEGEKKRARGLDGNL